MDLMVQLINANKAAGATRTLTTFSTMKTSAHYNSRTRSASRSTPLPSLSQLLMQPVAHGLPAVAVVPSDSVLPERTPAGHKAVLCPAQSRDVSCAESRLCAQADRTCVVMFKAHGTAKKTVDQLVA